MKALIAAALLLVCVSAGAASDDRLREQMRAVAGRLHSAEESASHAQAEKAAAVAERDRLQAQLDATKSELDALQKKSGGALAEAKRKNDQATQDLASTREQLATATQLAQGTEGQRARLDHDLVTRSASLDQCVAANAKLYDVGHEILAAYERVGLGDVLAVREPLVGKKRVAFENLAQEMGDRLYAGRYDPRMPPPAATSAPGGQP
jgi:uncharacterized protein (DUF3084 family)